MLLKVFFLVLCHTVLVSSRTVTVTSTRNSEAVSATTSELSDSDQTAAVTGCHMHGSEQFCIDSEGNEGSIVPSPHRRIRTRRHLATLGVIPSVVTLTVLIRQEKNTNLW